MTQRRSKQRREAAAIGDLLPKALEDLGVATRRVTREVMEAWDLAADARWRDEARPVRMTGGVLFVSVASSSLRQELSQFHAQRLLEVLRTALPRVALTDLRFTADSAGFHGER